MRGKALRKSGKSRPLVTGRIVIPAAVAAFSGATAHITLEDVSYADAGSSVVAEAVIPGLRHEPSPVSAQKEDTHSSNTGDGNGDTVLDFALRAEPGSLPIDPKNDYSVRVWVDRDSDGRRGPGDLYSDQSYKVLTRGFGSTVTITLGSSKS